MSSGPGNQPRSRRPFFVAVAAGLIVLVLGAAIGTAIAVTRRSAPSSAPPSTQVSCAPRSQLPAFSPASYKGLDYEFPTTMQGKYVGTEWLQAKNWPETSKRLDSDLTILQQDHLGNVLRVFVGLEQLMVWDKSTGFVRYDPRALERFNEALDIFHRHGFQLVLVLYDQEVAASAGNFHVQALDGNHQAMRTNYLRATQLFMQQFGSTPGVLGWDLFNEAYNSLSADGGQTKPAYSDAVVHGWLRDLYGAAKCGAPSAWLTVSDSTEFYGASHPDLGKYADCVDFLDLHVYDDHPELRNWAATLHKPVIIGEAGADESSRHYEDQAYNAAAVRSVLEQGQQNQVSAVLAHSDGHNVFSADGSLTPTGQVVSNFRD